MKSAIRITGMMILIVGLGMTSQAFSQTVHAGRPFRQSRIAQRSAQRIPRSVGRKITSYQISERWKANPGRTGSP